MIMAESKTDAVTRPLLRYFGGKWRLAPWIISHFPPHRVYVEPYGGAASVLLRKPRSYAEIYNDLSGEIVNLFKVVRERGSDLRRALQLTPFARDEYAESFAVSDDPVEQARRTAVRSFMGFGSNALQRSVRSGFRANSNRSGTTPAHDWNNYPAALGATIERLRGVVIENRNAADVILTHDSPDTLHYCDPPYVHATRGMKAHGHHGYDHEMSDEEHIAFLRTVAGVRGMVVISGYDCPIYNEQLAGWRKATTPALADGARKRTEVLWLSPNIKADGQQSLFEDAEPTDDTKGGEA